MTLVMGFFVIMAILAIGDAVSAKTKAFVPSIFIAALLLLVGFWSGYIPVDIVKKTGLSSPFANLCMYIIIVHMGTLMNIKELCAEWKTITIAAFGLVGMVAALLYGAEPIVGREAVLVAAPPLTGGLVAAIMMSEAAAAKGLMALSVMATVIYVVQGFVGYPLTALFLKFEGKRLLRILKEDGEELKKINAEKAAMRGGSGKRMIPEMPKKYQTIFMHLAVIGFVALISDYAAIGMKSLLTSINPAYAAYTLHPLVICLIFGAIAAEVGIIERKPLNKAESFGFIMATIMAFVLEQLSRATPEMILQIMRPLAVIIVIGVAGLLLLSALVGMFFGYSPFISMSLALTALYGFPPNYILTEEAARALADHGTKEYDFLMDCMLPKMLVGGFITVTITSVVLAGVFINMM